MISIGIIVVTIITIIICFARTIEDSSRLRSGNRERGESANLSSLINDNNDDHDNDYHDDDDHDDDDYDNDDHDAHNDYGDGNPRCLCLV